MKKNLRILSAVLLAVMMVLALASCQVNPKPSEQSKPTISYELYGGQNHPNNPKVYIGSQQLYKPTKDGFVFGGWYDNANFEGEPYTRVKDIKADIRFYAKWDAAMFNINYVLVQPGALNNNQNDTGFIPNSGTEILFLDAACPGYRFEGWYTTQDYKANTRVERMTPSAFEDITLYAKWSENKGMTTAPTVIPDHTDDSANYGSDSLRMVDVATTFDLQYYALKNGASGEFVRRQTESGDKVLLWDDVANHPQLAFTNLSDVDFTKYTHLEFWMYSANANGSMFGMVFWGDGKYRVYNVTLSWSGWKKISLDLNQPNSANGLALDGIQDLRLMADGWTFDILAFPNSFVYIDDIYLTNQSSPYQPNTTNFTDAELKEVKDRWRDLLVGNATLNASATSKAVSVGNTGMSYANSMNMASNRTYLWSGLSSLTTETVVCSNYERLNAMAKAWGTVGSNYYHNADLLAKIISGLTFLNEYDANGDGTPGCYGENVTIPDGQPGNWWHWDIGTPMELVDILIIIESELDDAFIEKMLAPLDYCIPKVEKTVANRTWVAYGVMGSALLHKDVDKYVKAVQDTLDVYNYVTTDDGFYADGSFIQHKKLSYIHSYGASFFTTLSFELYVIADTSFDIVMRDGKTFSNIYVEGLFKFFFDSCVPFVYNGTNVYTTSGRGMGVGDIKGQISNLIRIVEYAEPQTENEFYSMMKYFGQVNSSYADLTGNMSFVTLPIYKQYQSKINQIQARSDYYFNQVFAGMDRVMAYTPSYAAVLAMSSTRIYRYEAINNQGGQGWYLGDGALLLYGSDKAQYDSTYFSSIDKQMIPGTTVSSVRRENKIYTVDSNLLNHSSFVGGTSNGTYGVSAMILKYEKADKMGAYVSDLRAQKAYFFFDDEIVCVGSSISASHDGIYNTGEIYTVLGSHFGGDAALKINGKAASYNTTASSGAYSEAVVFENVNYLTVGNYDGYYFPNSNKANVSVRKYANHVQTYINHGEKPVDGSYLYVVLPGANDTQTGAYAANPDVEVLLDSNIITAVREKTLGVTGYVFWYGSYYDGIRVSESCIAMKTENKNGSFTYNVTDPTQLLSSVTVTLDGEWTIEGANATIENGKTVVTVITAGMLGAPITFTASK